MKAPIHIWDWDNTPEYLKNKILDHDDIDWVALVDKSIDIPGFMYPGSAFAVCDMEVYELASYWLIVAYHA